MPSDLKNMKLSALYDLLADYTSKYTLMMRWGGVSEGFKECRDAILQLQNEIDFRKTQADMPENKDLDDGTGLAPVLA